MVREKKMKAFRDYLKEQFKDKNLEEKFYKRLEKERIAAEILYYREKLNLTQKELAEKINSSQSAIARLEDSDYRGYSIKVLRKIADALGLELAVTFREKEKLEYEKAPAQIFYASVQTQQISSQLVTVADFKLEVAHGSAIGTGTTVGPTVGIGTTVDVLPSSLSPPIIRPNEGEWASA